MANKVDCSDEAFVNVSEGFTSQSYATIVHVKNKQNQTEEFIYGHSLPSTRVILLAM